MKVPKILQRLFENLHPDFKLEDVHYLPDGSGFAVGSFPLPKDHWLTQEGFNDPPMPFRIGTEERGLVVLPFIPNRKAFEDSLREVAKYAIRASTDNGRIIDFDPDAMVSNFVVGALGYYTPNGLSALDGHDETPRTLPMLNICGRCFDEAEVLYPANCDEDPEKLTGQPIGQYHCPNCGAMVLAGSPHPELCLLCLERRHPSMDRNRV